jgi:hypothetical protein
MYATIAFAITMLGIFSIFENIKGGQKLSLLKYYMLLAIMCLTISSFLDFLDLSGYSIPYYKEIARRLELKPNTVSTFKKKIFAKFHVDSDVDLYKILKES